MHMTMAAPSASNFIPAPTFTTAQRSRCFSITPISIRPRASITIRAISSCSNSTTAPSSSFTAKRISGFHVKDAEFRPSGRVGVYGGYQPWDKRAGRFRSLGDGQVDFSRVFSLMTSIGFDGWAVLEWECCVKSPEQGAREGAPFIRRHLIEPTTVAFDDFAGAGSDAEANRAMLGLA